MLFRNVLHNTLLSSSRACFLNTYVIPINVRVVWYRNVDTIWIGSVPVPICDSRSPNAELTSARPNPRPAKKTEPKDLSVDLNDWCVF